MSILVAAAVVTLTAVSADATFPGNNGLIAYGTGYGEVWVISEDGADPHRLTRGIDGAFSPDGSMFATTRIRDRQGIFDSEIFLVDVSTGDVTQLTDHRRFASRWPAWSPDGSEIVFQRCCHRQTDLYIKDIDGAVRQLTDASDDFGRLGRFASNPTWSPDGSTIVFEVCCYGVTQNANAVSRLYAISPDGSEVRRLIATDGYSHYDASFSPDGSTVAFATCCYSSRRDLSRVFTINIDGTAITQITQRPHMADEEPVFSPDGTKIAFTRCCPDGQEGPDIFTMDAAGESVERLTSTLEEEFVLDWEPNP